MLSSVLHSKEAIRVNVAIMRIFVKLRDVSTNNKTIVERIKKLEFDYDEIKEIFNVVFNKFSELERKLPILPNERKKIGL